MIVIPMNVITIGNNVFRSCTSLQYVYYLGTSTPSSVGTDIFYSTQVYTIRVKNGYSVTLDGKSSTAMGKSSTGSCSYFIDTTTGLFVVYGSGSMGNYRIESTPYSSAPWTDQRHNIKYAIFEYGVTNVASSSFLYWDGNWDNTYKNVKYARIGNTVTTIGQSAFDGNQELQILKIGYGVTTIEKDILVNSNGLNHIYFYGANEPSFAENVFNMATTSPTIHVLLSYSGSTTSFCGYERPFSQEL